MGKSGLWCILLLSSIAVLFAVLCTVSLYKSYSCTKICISKLSQDGEYTSTAKVTYLNSLIPNSKVEVIINNAYKTTISTDSESDLRFQAPLKIGIDAIKIEYDGYPSTATFFYLGDLLYMILIPFGAGLFLFMRKLASNLTGEEKLTFYTNNAIPKVHPQSLKLELERISNNAKRTVPGLPELVRDIPNESKDSSYLCQKLETQGIALASFGCFSSSQITKELAAVRKFYEYALKSGESCSLHAKTPQAFLSTNRIVFLNDISGKKLHNLSKKNGKIRLILTSADDANVISRLTRSYSTAGAILLLLQTSSFIEMIVGFD